MKHLHIRQLLYCCALAVWPFGCGGQPDTTVLDITRQKSTEPYSDQGLLWMFPGLVGAPWEMGAPYRGLREAGLVRHVEFFQWGDSERDFFKHLTEYERNRERADDVALQIVDYRDRYPEQPIDLVGYSAGGALAIWVAEALPEDVRLNNVVLAQPDLSPTYDLTEALRRIDGQLIVFHSAGDVILAGGFTRLFGTLDRKFVIAAGKDGFDLDVAVADETLRSRVEQVGWSPEWAAVGHPGTHMAILQYCWNRYIVAPHLLEEDDPQSELLRLTGELLGFGLRQAID